VNRGQTSGISKGQIWGGQIEEFLVGKKPKEDSKVEFGELGNCEIFYLFIHHAVKHRKEENRLLKNHM